MDMKPKSDPMRANARKLIDKDVLTMNASNSVNRAKNPMVSRSKIANDRPLTFAKGGKVKHDDAAQDRKMIASMIKSAEKKEPVEKACGGKVMKKARGGMMSSPQKAPANGMVKKTPIAQTYAAGGSAKIRRGMATPSGAIKNVMKKGKMDLI